MVGRFDPLCEGLAASRACFATGTLHRPLFCRRVAPLSCRRIAPLFQCQPHACLGQSRLLTGHNHQPSALRFHNTNRCPARCTAPPHLTRSLPALHAPYAFEKPPPTLAPPLPHSCIKEPSPLKHVHQHPLALTPSRQKGPPPPETAALAPRTRPARATLSLDLFPPKKKNPPPPETAALAPRTGPARARAPAPAKRAHRNQAPHLTRRGRRRPPRQPAALRRGQARGRR
eukprot:18801-Chlamydomonas_euryale.AAC.1